LPPAEIARKCVPTSAESKPRHEVGQGLCSGLQRQTAVDAQAPVIVAQSLSNSPTHARQFAPIVAQIKPNIDRQAQELCADAGYCSEDNGALLSRQQRVC
jgi:hypothetical protein